MPARTRPYLFYDTAVSLCSICYRRIDAKIVFEDDNVFMLKRCPQHGFERVLIADDVDYYRRCREVFLKPPEMPDRYNTPIKHGCPYDCGLCPDHEQHSCLSLLEICDACNLSCPICYAQSGTHRTEFSHWNRLNGCWTVSAQMRQSRMWFRYLVASQRSTLISLRYSMRRSDVPFAT